MSEPVCYVYVYEVDGVVRYVGRGSNSRIGVHFRNATRFARGEKTKQIRFYSRLADAIDRGAKVIANKIFHGLTVGEARSIEMREISRYPREQLWNTVFSSDPKIDDEQWRAAASEIQKALWADPAEREKRLEGMARAFAEPGVRERQAAATRAALARPGVEERRLAGLLAAAQDPAKRAKRAAGIREAYRNPEVKERHRIALKEAFATPEQKERRSLASKRIRARPEDKARRVAATKEMMARPGAKERLSLLAADQWADPARRAKLLAGSERARQARAPEDVI